MHGAYLISYKYNFLQELENLQICLFIYPDGADNDKPSQTCLFWILQIVLSSNSHQGTHGADRVCMLYISTITKAYPMHSLSLKQ